MAGLLRARPLAAALAAAALAAPAFGFVGAAPAAPAPSSAPAAAPAPAPSAPATPAPSASPAPSAAAAPAPSAASLDAAAFAAIRSRDAAALAELYSKGATPAFDNRALCAVSMIDLEESKSGEFQAALDKRIALASWASLSDAKAAAALAYESVGELVVPTACSKLHMLAALRSKWGGLPAPARGAGIGAVPSERSPLALDWARASVPDGTDGAASKRAELAAAVEKARAEDLRWRQTLALVDANAPAADKYLYPLYALMLVESGGDYTAARWLIRRWKDALPDIRKARELKHPGREAFHEIWSKSYSASLGVDGGRYDARWREPAPSAAGALGTLSSWRPEGGDEAVLARVASEVLKSLPEDAAAGQASLCRAWAANWKNDTVAGGRHTGFPEVPADALRALEAVAGWTAADFRALASARPVDMAGAGSIPRWSAKSAEPTFVAASRKAEALALLRETIREPGPFKAFAEGRDAETGETVLHYMARKSSAPDRTGLGKGQVDILSRIVVPDLWAPLARALVERGADPDAKDGRGRSARDILRERRSGNDPVLPRMEAAFGSRTAPEDQRCVHAF